MSWHFEGTLLPRGEHGTLAIGTDPSSLAAEPLPGRYALTGLVDAHAHLTVRDDRSLGDRGLAERRLDAYAATGVVLVRDVGGRSDVTCGLAARHRPGRPWLEAAGRFLAPEGRYFPRMHDPVPPSHLIESALEELDAGATWLKVIGDFPLLHDGVPTPGSLAPTYDLDLMTELVRVAHRHGARVAVHTQSRHSSRLVAAGVDSVEHGEWLDEHAVRRLGARHGAWTPTLSAVVDPPQDAPARRQAYAAEASERLRTLLPLARECGVRILAGTDNAGTIAREVALLARHGLDPADALAAASSAAEAWLHPSLEQHSVVTYASDPRDDPAVLESPTAVVVHGQRLR